MAQPELNQRLTTVDASFLYFERKEAPLHIGGIHVFDGEIPYDDFMRLIDAKLYQLPRYQQIVRPAPFNVGHPTWEFDPNFDVKRHVFQVQIDAPGTSDQLRELAAQLLNGMLDRDKPLWEIYVVKGLEGGKGALVSKVHHAMVDGISGVDLMKIMFDISPNTTIPAKVETPKPAPRSSMDLTRSYIDGLLGGLEEGMKSWNEFQRSLLNLTETFIKDDPRKLRQSTQNLIPSVAAPVSLMPFNKPNSGQQKLGWSAFSFAEARAIRAAIGGTVNDVVLTVLSGAISTYVEMHGMKTAGRTLRVMVPVSMRKEDQRGALGNLVSILPVEIPLDLKNPLERYAFLTKKTGTLKGAKVAEGINLLSALMGTVPASIQAVVGSLANTSVPPFNIVCTNVPGPQIPLYVLGQKMTESWPYVPTSFSLGVSVGIMSYDQKLFFGVIADAQAMPDVDKLIQYLNESFAELRTAAGVVETRPPEVDTTSAKTTKSRSKARGASAKAKERLVTD